MYDHIYTELSVKSINMHYINRYMSFIKRFNGSGKISHHALPKAKDVWPQYVCLKTHTWNDIKLGDREHFVAHWILWKALGGSQLFAFNQMKHKNKQKLNSRTYQLLLEDFRLNHPMKNRQVAAEVRRRSSNRMNTVTASGEKLASQIARLATVARLNNNPNSFFDAAAKTRSSNIENGSYERRQKQLGEAWKDDEYRKSASISMSLEKNSESYKSRNTHVCDHCNKSVIGLGNLKQHKRKCDVGI